MIEGASRSDAVMLSPESVEAVARRVVELLRDSQPSTRFVSAAELARVLGVDRSFVYEHADELGARRLGLGRKPRLRFDLDEAQRAVSCFRGRESEQPQTSMVEPKRRHRRRVGLGTTVPLLPVKGAEHDLATTVSDARPRQQAA